MGINREGTNGTICNRPVPLISVGILLLLFFGNTISEYCCYSYVKKRKRRNQSIQNALTEAGQRYRNETANKVDVALQDIGNENPRINYDDKVKIIASLTPTLLGNSKRPAVFLFLKPCRKQGFPQNQDEKGCEQLVRDLAEACNKLYESSGHKLIIKAHEDFVTEENVRESFAEIEEAFSKSSSKVVVIEDVDKIKNETIFTYLHSCCDNDYAPYKNVSFFFTATTQNLENDPSQTEANRLSTLSSDGIRNNILNAAWFDFEEDKRKALIARIGPNTILISDKKQTSIEEAKDDEILMAASSDRTIQAKSNSSEESNLQNNDVSTLGDKHSTNIISDNSQVETTNLEENCAGDIKPDGNETTASKNTTSDNIHPNSDITTTEITITISGYHQVANTSEDLGNTVLGENHQHNTILDNKHTSADDNHRKTISEEKQPGNVDSKHPEDTISADNTHPEDTISGDNTNKHPEETINGLNTALGDDHRENTFPVDKQPNDKISEEKQLESTMSVEKQPESPKILEEKQLDATILKSSKSEGTSI